MHSEAIFENIASRLVSEICKSKESIYVAIAWFTNKNIFNELVRKSNDGLLINLMYSDDEINRRSSVNFDLLSTKNSYVYRIGDGEANLMHNKFCVIDRSTVITGSYNWSNRAESNHENITVIYGDRTLAKQFIIEFNRIKQKYYPDPEIETKSKELPLDIIIRRLEIVKNFILLNEVKEVIENIKYFKAHSLSDEINNIVRLIDALDLSNAVIKIDNYIINNRKISTWQDPDIASLNLQIKCLENQIAAFDNERIDLEKTLNNFQHRHTIELGDLILQILSLRALKFKNEKTKYDDARKDEEEYKSQFTSEKSKNIVSLSTEEKNKLKYLYRKATTLCHPDKFINEAPHIVIKAEKIFKLLNEANALNDLDKVTEILEQLESGLLNVAISVNISDKDVLMTTINELRVKLLLIENKIYEIKQSSIYKTIIEIDNLDMYFKLTRQKLELELMELKKT